MPRRSDVAVFSVPHAEPQLDRAARRALGAYYTPPEVVELVVKLALEPVLGRATRPPTIIDPACGAGEFLAAAARRLTQRFGSAATVCGIDLDDRAIDVARERLPRECHVYRANALESESAQNESFEVVLGNPPYLSIRQLAKSLPAQEIERLRQQFCMARGNFDLYVLFIERALALLKPGGRCGFVVPNKWATLDYARPCRELLLEQATIEHVVDLSDQRVFAAASVYPHVLVFRKQRAKARHVVRFHASFDPQAQGAVRQGSLSSAGFQFAAPLDVESRVLTQPLGELARLSCGTAGYAAQRLARQIRNATEGVPYGADFITSGNIDRYAIRLGNVRFLGRTYDAPRLPLNVPELTAAKRRLFESPKVVIAGMSRRLEAAWDQRGLALGVQVFAASEIDGDPFYLLALLNSKLLSYLFATRFAAKRLAGGYLAINKGQLARLPITVERASSLAYASNKRGRLFYETSQRLAELGRVLTGPAGGPPHEDEVDRLVYRLYRLTDAEIARVEGHFAAPATRAA